jgi:hypothetical protein
MAFWKKHKNYSGLSTRTVASALSPEKDQERLENLALFLTLCKSEKLKSTCSTDLSSEIKHHDHFRLF